MVDGTSYLYRAYYTFPYWINKYGEPSGAIYGVINMLRKIILKYQDNQIIVVFDSPNKTFRHAIFKKYKKNRPAMPEDLKKQIPFLYKIIKLIGIPLILVPSVEADDIIGTLSYRAEKIGLTILISSNDKDMLQLVTEKINIINTTYDVIIGPKEIKKKYGITPKLMIDLLALMGDVVDNIPGIPGIGEKTALMLIKHFGCLEKIYEEIENIKILPIHGAKNISIKIKKNKEIAFLSKKLSTIKLDIPLDVDLENLKTSKLKKQKLLHFFNHYNFKKWKKQVENDSWLTTKK
ncbi:5'-3' exonuclease H3TH domain-containing protein [Buchnera aphidicola]|uniref:5'-3' exonuclease n=1 Tax=Buchnera aphidicola TaxID=9 RepID=UPI003463F4B5